MRNVTAKQDCKRNDVELGAADSLDTEGKKIPEDRMACCVAVTRMLYTLHR
jgi:hypothetical protein